VLILSHVPRTPIDDRDSDDEADNDFDDAKELVSIYQYEQELRQYRRMLLELSDMLAYVQRRVGGCVNPSCLTSSLLGHHRPPQPYVR
jgi:hypothetical protein